jgi:antitoxin component YwqK of YwqJK toxin-antitoxin module
MKHFFTIILLLCLTALSIQAQELKISDIEMMNLGDGRLFARKAALDEKDQKPINGRVRIITGYTTEYIDAGFDNGYADGKWEYYSRNKLSEVMNYSKGLLNGEKIIYYEDGKIKEQSMMKDGKVQKRTTYFTDGKVERERNFDEDGKEHSTDKRYDWKTGKLKAELNYIHGKQVGKQVRYMTSNVGDYTETSYYNEAGLKDGDYSEIFIQDNNVKAKGQYINDKKNGKWIYGYEHGVLYKEETYDNGQLVDTKNLR